LADDSSKELAGIAKELESAVDDYTGEYIIDEDALESAEAANFLIYRDRGNLSYVDFRKPLFPAKFQPFFKDYTTKVNPPVEELFERYTIPRVMPKPLFPNKVVVKTLILNKHNLKTIAPEVAESLFPRTHETLFPEEVKKRSMYDTSNPNTKHIIEAAREVYNRWKLGKRGLTKY